MGVDDKDSVESHSWSNRRCKSFCCESTAVATQSCIDMLVMKSRQCTGSIAGDDSCVDQAKCEVRFRNLKGNDTGWDENEDWKERKCFHHDKKESGCNTVSVDNGAVSVERSAVRVSCKEKPEVDETSDDDQNFLKIQTILIVVKHDSNVIWDTCGTEEMWAIQWHHLVDRTSKPNDGALRQWFSAPD